MQINMTIVLQAIHFFIAYILLKRLLLRPVFGIIEQETMQMDALVDTIESRTVIVQEKKRDCKERWAQYQQEMRSHVPAIEHQESVIQHISPLYTVPHYSPTHSKTVTHDVTRALTEKVKHVIE
jgi:hypothetical protein